MGAGLSGLSCAITLEKNGISPFIFEKRCQVGDRFVNCEIILSVLHKQFDDSLSYFSNEYNIYLQPTSNINKLIVYSENEKAIIEGNLGFTNLRGRDQDSFEKQLASQVNNKINFNSTYSYEQLLNDYTHVVVATGDAAYSEKNQGYKEKITVTLKGATIVGDFDRRTVMAWLNYDLAPKGYGYLIPISEKEANIVIGYPEYSENMTKDPQLLWEIFYQDVCEKLEQDFKITDNFQIRKYMLGICSQPRIGNSFFTGNCFGSIMPFLGFGQFASIMTGVYAAYDLCGLGNYNKLTKSLKKSFYHSLTLRKGLEKLDNSKLDWLVKSLDGKLGNKLFNSKYDFLKIASYLLKPWV